MWTVWWRDRRVAAIGAGVAVLLLVGGVMIIWYARPDDPARDGTSTFGGDDAFGAGLRPSATTTVDAQPSAAPAGYTTTAPTAAPKTYPATTDDYALATLNAWLARNNTRVGELAVPGAITLMGQAPSGLAGGWEFYGCWNEPFAPCRQLRNDKGDVFSVSVDPAKLGRPKAVTRAYKDFTRYEATAMNYLFHVLDAWGASNDERVATLIDGQTAVWWFSTIAKQGDHNAFTNYTQDASALDPANLVCITGWVSGTSWTWAIDKRLLGRAHALVWAGGEQVC